VVNAVTKDFLDGLAVHAPDGEPFRKSGLLVDPAVHVLTNFTPMLRAIIQQVLDG
jgi:hypothetical protein